jgi:SAM-dependent methyltransferase
VDTGTAVSGMVDQDFYNPFLANFKWLGKMSRKARIEMYEIFLREVSPTPESTILDVGVSVTHDERTEENILEKLYPYSNRITMLGIHDGTSLEKHYSGARYIRYQGDSVFPFSDNEFDICYCHAVLEHVGEEKIQQQFIRELLRVGRKLFLTTPNRAYPIDFHKMLPLLHWLPMKTYRRIIAVTGDKFYSQNENLNLLYKSDLRRLFQFEGEPFRILSHRWFGLPANLIVIAK